jgi:arylsulfatase A
VNFILSRVRLPLRNFAVRRSARPTLIALLIVAVFQVAAIAAERPNIILLFIDDLGYGDFGCFGSPTIQTPNIDGVARRGVKLTSFYSAPTCVPARQQLMLGKYSARVNLGGTGAGGKGGIPEGEVTLAQALKGAGYATAMVGKWHLGSAEPRFLPTNRGFDSWFGLPYSNDMVKPWVQTDEPLWLYENEKKIEHPVNLGTLTQRYTERAVDFIRRKRTTPFFLYFATSMPHLPLATRDGFRGKSRAGLYGDVVEEIDWGVGEMLKALRDSDQEKNTLFIITSDNGPWIELPPRMLQAGNTRWHVGSAGPLRGAKASTYEGGVREPAIVHWPGHFEGGRTTAEIAATMDLYATLIRLATGAPPKHQTDGYDLTDLLAGKTTTSPRQEFFYFDGKRLDGVRVGSWKLRLRGTEPELFNLDLDPSERVNRAEEMPERVAELKQRMQAMLAETPLATHSWK